MTGQATGRNEQRESLSRDAAALNLMEFWEERADLELLQPRRGAEPCLWRWSDIEPRLYEAAVIVPLEEAERRALLFSNPGLAPRPFMTNTVFGAYSLYNPGEHAPVHRHTPSASRMLLEGEGAYTTVEGEKCTMHRGDLILTPNGTWHDHGNDGGAPIIWMDVLDLPLVEALNSTVFEFDYAETDQQSNTGEEMPRTTQSIRHPHDHSQNLYGGGGLKPVFVDHERGITPHSPMFVYRAENTREQLDRLRDYDGSPYDGIIVEFCDPATGASVMPTLSYTAQLLRPGEHTRSHRHTANAIYCVIEGEGHTEVDGKRLEWTRNDAFCVPAWMWHEHVNGDSDAVLYSVTDAPTLKKLGLYREDGKTPDGEVVRLSG